MGKHFKISSIQSRRMVRKHTRMCRVFRRNKQLPISLCEEINAIFAPGKE